MTIFKLQLWNNWPVPGKIFAAYKPQFLILCAYKIKSDEKILIPYFRSIFFVTSILYFLSLIFVFWSTSGLPLYSISFFFIPISFVSFCFHFSFSLFFFHFYIFFVFLSTYFLQAILAYKIQLVPINPVCRNMYFVVACKWYSKRVKSLLKFEASAQSTLFYSIRTWIINSCSSIFGTL